MCHTKLTTLFNENYNIIFFLLSFVLWFLCTTEPKMKLLEKKGCVYGKKVLNNNNTEMYKDCVNMLRFKRNGKTAKWSNTVWLNATIL